MPALWVTTAARTSVGCRAPCAGDCGEACGRGAARPGCASDLDEVVVEGVADELRARRAVDLLLDVRAVRLDGAGGEEQVLRDLRVGVPERDQLQHLALALGEVVRRPGG